VLDHAKRAFALRKYEQAVEHYATALKLLFVPLPFVPTSFTQLVVSYRGSKTYAEDVLVIADVYFVYGKALFEIAIAHNSLSWDGTAATTGGLHGGGRYAPQTKFMGVCSSRCVDV
jgi:hypothetical protein